MSRFSTAKDRLENLRRGAPALFSAAETQLEMNMARVSQLQTVLDAKDAEAQSLLVLLAQRSATIRAQDDALAVQEQRLATLKAALLEHALKVTQIEEDARSSSQSGQQFQHQRHEHGHEHEQQQQPTTSQTDPKGGASREKIAAYTLHILQRQVARAFNAWWALKLMSDERRRQSVLTLERSKQIRELVEKYQKCANMRRLRGAFGVWAAQ